MDLRITCILGLLFLLGSASSAGAFDAGMGTGTVVAPPCAKAEEHFVTVDHLRVHYVESGKGPTLVLIHGNAGAAEDFALGTIGLLCGDYRIVAVDRAGHGKSQRPGGKTATVEYQADLL